MFSHSICLYDLVGYQNDQNDHTRIHCKVCNTNPFSSPPVQVPFQIENFRNEAKAILEFVRKKVSTGPDFTILQFIDGLKGSEYKFTEDEQNQLRVLSRDFFAGFEKCDLDRFLRKMLCDDLLSVEVQKIKKFGTLVGYLRLGNDADHFCGEDTVQFEFPVKVRYKQLLDKRRRLGEDYDELQEQHQKLQEEHQKLREEHQKLQEKHQKLQERHDEDLLGYDPIDSMPIQMTSPTASTSDGSRKRKREMVED